MTATDVSERALAFTAFNAALAAVGPDRLELLAGSLLEPVAGRRFDLIVTNPPFVLTPPAVREAGLPLMEYRDAGRPVLPGLVAGLGEHLEKRDNEYDTSGFFAVHLSGVYSQKINRSADVNVYVRADASYAKAQNKSLVADRKSVV